MGRSWANTVDHFIFAIVEARKDVHIYCSLVESLHENFLVVFGVDAISQWFVRVLFPPFLDPRRPTTRSNNFIIFQRHNIQAPPSPVE